MKRFRFIRKLSRGAHGTVYLFETTDSRKERVACKSILWKYRKHAEREIRMLSSMSHKRIVRLLDFFPRDSGVFIILEYMSCGSLHEAISQLAENECKASGYLAWSVLAQIAEALCYLHSKQIVHRDVKPSNILMGRISSQNSGSVQFKLCDFSIAKRLHKESGTYGIAGTPAYMAPEVVSGEHYDFSADVWSLGVSIYELLTLKKPFEGRSKNELFEMIKQAKLPQVVCADIELERLIRRCLSRNNRITSGEIHDDKGVRARLQVPRARPRNAGRFSRARDHTNIDKRSRKL
ncbi:protein kinase domain-containing protein [Encephalitozoon hellem]|nr:protein kinase domain-containing protein [Encephalitozoon hellem]